MHAKVGSLIDPAHTSTTPLIMHRIMQPAVFLDRDNTLIANEGDLGDPSRVELIDGVAAGLRALREAGYRLIVVTNQGGVARGKYTENDVDAVNQRIARLVDEHAGASGLIDRFYYCPYHPEATVAEYRREHPWRKPNPGMLVQAARDLDLDLERSWLIGDQMRDIQAGHAAGCSTVLVAEDATLIAEAHPTHAASSFADAVGRILKAHPGDQGSRQWSEGSGGQSAPSAGSPPESTGTEHGSGAEGTPSRSASKASSEPLLAVRRAVQDLTEELRAERMQRMEFTPMRMVAGLTQLLVLLCVLLGLLQVQQSEVFFQWFIAAVLLQLFVITMLLAESR